MRLKKYNEFLNINESELNIEEDIFNLPLDSRKEITSELEKIYNTKGNISESIIMDMYRTSINKLKKWLGKKAVSYLINLSQKDLSDKINKLKILDPTDFSDIEKVEVMYLGGGIDKASESGASGWRDRIEEFYGSDNIIKGEDMIRLAKSGKINTDKYPKPDKEKDDSDWKYWADAINKEIHAPDLRIVNACDTNLVKLDPSAGAGTMGEMQVSSLRGLNIFVWLDNGYTVKDISPWLVPTITKLVRNEEELSILLENIKKINN